MPDAMRSLHVHWDGHRMGEVREGEGLWQFAYDDEWLRRADAFDLSPALRRRPAPYQDGGSDRPVQWFFDNLLPEEALRDAIAQEAGVRGHDAFALLAYLGAESAGSLTLTPPGEADDDEFELRPLPMGEISRRIRELPRRTLVGAAPKRMSLAGAQHKLLVVRIDGQWFDPVGATPSTYLLKPDHPDVQRYPASTANEFITMRTAAGLGLDVPDVSWFHAPEPLYGIQRFDRIHDGLRLDRKVMRGQIRRLHIIDGCQLLNRDRTSKYSGATLEGLRQLAERSTNRAATRLALFRWLVFNVLMANDDNHLKNLSFFVDAMSVRLAPHYDLLATGVYSTRAFADDAGRWPHVPMTITLPGATTYDEVRRESLIEAGALLGIASAAAIRIVARMTAGLSDALRAAFAEVEAGLAVAPEAAKAAAAGTRRMMSVLERIIVAEMLARTRVAR